MSEPRTPCKRSAPPLPPHRVGFLDAGAPSGAAIRTTIAAIGAMALAFAMHLEVPALAVVFVLARGSAGTITMVTGAIAGSACGLVLLDLFDQSRVAFSLALFALGTIGTYGALGRRAPFGWVQALLSLLILVGQSLDSPDTAVGHAFHDLANVLVAAFCAFVAGASPPAAVPAQLQDTLAARLRGLASLAGCGTPASADAVVALERGARRSRILLANAWPTRLASRARVRALAAAAAFVDRAHDDVLILLARERLIRARPFDGAVRDEVGRALEDAAALVIARPGPLDDDRETRAAAARGIARRLRRAPGSGDASLPGLVARRVRHLAARIALLSPFLEPGTRSLPRFAAAVQPPYVLPTLDRFRLRHAVKSATSYLFVLWAWVAVEWGAIVPALVVSVLVATLATPVGATLRKAVLRVAGALVGGIAGLLVAVVLLPFITDLAAICCVCGVFLLAFSWIQQHRERLTFAAMQASIAFVLTLVHGTAPSPTWREPLESVIGLAFGIVVVVGIMHAAWPIDATTSAHTTLAELLELCGRRIEALLRSDPGYDAAARRRDRAAAAAAREHAAGFVHEVELYGTQFGRPAENLAALARPVLELDALVALLEALPAAASGTHVRTAPHGVDAFTSAVRQDCRFLASCVRAFPGEREPCGDGDLETARCASPLSPTGTSAHDATRSEAYALIDELLRDLVRTLSDDARPARRRAA